MKHLILLLFALLLLGCKDNGNDSPEIIEKAVKFERIGGKQSLEIYKFTYQNHDYLCGYKGGIIHSQSCRCLNP